MIVYFQWYTVYCLKVYTSQWLMQVFKSLFLMFIFMLCCVIRLNEVHLKKFKHLLYCYLIQFVTASGSLISVIIIHSPAHALWQKGPSYRKRSPGI